MFGVFSLLTIGAVAGPVAIAVISAWVNAEDELGVTKTSEASRLVAAYRQRLPRHRLFLSIIPPEDGTECGYEVDDVFPDGFGRLVEAVRSQRFTEYAGYYALDRWRNKNRDEEWIAAITTSIDEQMSDFEAGFLRRCIEATLFSDICMKQVAAYGDSGKIPRFDHTRPISPFSGTGIEDQIVCTYVDGVAVRNGISLSDWNFEKKR
ncbi:hypothetical protein A8B75_19420 [Sphingomonadales bacterium EhC05]|nr:hypothetical protein A8B75_19420 [Sphingomonadales bacterium EhC05]